MTYTKDNIQFQPKPTLYNFIDLTGQRFTRLFVLGYAGQGHWWCKCDCGTITRPMTSSLRGGNTRSCGCIATERIVAFNITHGKTNSPEYRSYLAAKGRCNRPQDKRWEHYGGRGIEFRFNSFEEFYEHIGSRPSIQHTLDRIDNDGHYEKGNVRWSLPIPQANNKSTTPMITYQGQTQSLADWCRELHLKYIVVYHRLFKHKWPIEDALSVPIVYPSIKRSQRDK